MSDWISIDPLPQALTPTQEYIKEQLAAGKSPQAIAHRLHLRADHVADEIYEIRKKECMMGKPLTEEQKAQILEMRARGKSYHSIAMAVGCAQQSCANVCNAAKLKAELAAEQAADLPETQEAPENLPEKKSEGKPGKINEDFDAAVDQMIEDAKAEKNAAIAEKNSTNANTEQPKEPAVLPECVINAIRQRLRDLEEEIQNRQSRIAELKEEIAELCLEFDNLNEWRDQYQ